MHAGIAPDGTLVSAAIASQAASPEGTEQTVSVVHLRLAVASNAGTVALVLLPGMDGTGQLFGDFLEAFGSEVHTIVVSYPPGQALDYAQLEVVVRAQLPTGQSFVLLGESFSGPIAVSIAASAPSGLCGLVLCCSFVQNPWPLCGGLKTLTHIFPIGAIPTIFLSRIVLGRFAAPPQRRALAQVLAQVSSTVLRARMRAVLSVNVAALLPHVSVPVLYLRASEDRVVPRAASQLIAQLLPRVRITDLEAPHFLLQAAPAEAAQHVGSFVREVSSHNLL